MPKVPEASTGGLPPGIYHVQIAACVEKRSATKNYLMFEARLHAIDFDKLLCYDRFMFEGDGQGITSAKLSTLGFPPGKNVEANDLIGLRCYVEVAQNDKYLNVDIKAPGSKCGYFPDGAEPAGTKKPVVSTEEAPF